MLCHKVDYKILGHDLQLVEIELDHNETVIAEAGAMTYMENGIQFEAKMGDGSNPTEGFFSKLWSAGKRALSGESIFITHFTNTGYQKSRVAFAAAYPGHILPIDMRELPGQKLFCQKDAFLAAALGTSISVAFTKRLGAGFFGGEGFILQKLEGDGLTFIHAGGTLVKKELRQEKLRLDAGCLVAFSEGIDYSIEFTGSLKSSLFGGEGLFLATLSGTGTVWVQSLPFSRLAEQVIARIPPPPSQNKF